MADTEFTDYVTPVPAAWLNDVNDHVYNDTPVSPATTVHDASVIANTPAGTIVAVTVQAAIDELDTDVSDHTSDTVGAHAATAISNTPAGSIAATTVQAAIDELDTEKAALAGSATQDFAVNKLTVSETEGIVGTTTNNNAQAGSVGEVISSQVLIAFPVALTTATAAGITSISLTAGDWDVSGHIGFITAASTVVSGIAGLIDSSVAYSSDAAMLGRNIYAPASTLNTPANGTPVIPINSGRISLASTTTIYLVAYAIFTTSTCSAFGIITARRAR